MKICIYDEDVAITQFLSRRITAFEQADLPFSITLAESKSGFFESAEKIGGFDVVFIAVQLTDGNGIAMVEEMKTMFPKTIIVFLTSCRAVCCPQAFYCLAKPINEDEFDAVFTLAVKKYIEINRSIVVKWQNKRTRIPLDEISFIEGYNRHLIVHTINGKYETVGKIPDIYAILQPQGFVRTHQGFIVNMHYIRMFDTDSVLLTNGQRVMMSVRMRYDALVAYDHFTDKQYLVI